MNNNTHTLWTLVGGIIVGLLIAPWLIPMMGFGGMMGRRSTTSTGALGVAQALDQHFIEQMIPHHEGAIAMANLALQKAVHPEIQALAQAILVAQTAENEDMRTWYKEWFGKSVPEERFGFSGGMMSGGMMSGSGMHMGSRDDIAVLENAADFDKEFIEQMIPHHQMAIMMARMLEAGTNRPEMQELADNIQRSQADEIEQMQEWYQEWYQ